MKIKAPQRLTAAAVNDAALDPDRLRPRLPLLARPGTLPDVPVRRTFSTGMGSRYTPTGEVETAREPRFYGPISGPGDRIITGGSGRAGPSRAGDDIADHIGDLLAGRAAAATCQ